MYFGFTTSTTAAAGCFFDRPSLAKKASYVYAVVLPALSLYSVIPWTSASKVEGNGEWRGAWPVR